MSSRLNIFWMMVLWRIVLPEYFSVSLCAHSSAFLSSPFFSPLSICTCVQNGKSSAGDRHQSGFDWGCGGTRLPPQTPVLSNCGLPHQEQPQHGGKTGCSFIIYFFLKVILLSWNLTTFFITDYHWHQDQTNQLLPTVLFLASGVVHSGVRAGVSAGKVHEEGLFWTTQSCRNGGRDLFFFSSYCVMHVKHCLNCKVQQHISAAPLLSAVSIWSSAPGTRWPRRAWHSLCSGTTSPHALLPSSPSCSSSSASTGWLKTV